MVSRCSNAAAHEQIAGVIWDAPSDADAVTGLERLAASEQLLAWEEEVRAGSRDDRDSSRGGGQGKRDRDEERG